MTNNINDGGENKCEICGKSNTETRIIKSKKFNMTLCNRHYIQLQVHGKIFESTNRNNNKIITKDNYVIMNIEKNEKVYEVKIDIDDIDKIIKYRWFINDSGYAMTHINNINTRMHRLILNFPDCEIDHINRDKLDNRKINLRSATHQENSANNPVRRTNNSGVIGVSFDKHNNKWRSQITYNFKDYNLGRFTDKNDAIKARLNAEKQFFKEFAPQKHLFNQYNII